MARTISEVAKACASLYLCTFEELEFPTRPNTYQADKMFYMIYAIYAKL